MTSADGRPLVTVKLEVPTLVTALAAVPFPSNVPQVVSTLEPRPGSPPLSDMDQAPDEVDAVAVAVKPVATLPTVGAVVLSQSSIPAIKMSASTPCGIAKAANIANKKSFFMTCLSFMFQNEVE